MWEPEAPPIEAAATAAVADGPMPSSGRGETKQKKDCFVSKESQITGSTYSTKESSASIGDVTCADPSALPECFPPPIAAITAAADKAVVAVGGAVAAGATTAAASAAIATAAAASVSSRGVAASPIQPVVSSAAPELIGDGVAVRRDDVAAACFAGTAIAASSLPPDGSAAPALLDVLLQRKEKQSKKKREEGSECRYEELEDEIYSLASEVRDPEFPAYSLGDLIVVTPELVRVTEQQAVTSTPHTRNCSRKNRVCCSNFHKASTSSSSSSHRSGGVGVSDVQRKLIANGSSSDHQSSSSGSSNTTSSSDFDISSSPDNSSNNISSNSFRSSSSSDSSCSEDGKENCLSKSSYEWNYASGTARGASSVARSSRRHSISSMNVSIKEEQKRNSKSVSNSHSRINKSTQPIHFTAIAGKNSEKQHSEAKNAFPECSSSDALRDPSSHGSSSCVVVVDANMEKKDTTHNTRMNSSSEKSNFSESTWSDELGTMKKKKEASFSLKKREEATALVATVGLRPTNARCSLASLIGLAVHCKLEQHLHFQNSTLRMMPQHLTEDRVREAQQQNMQQQRNIQQQRKAQQEQQQNTRPRQNTQQHRQMTQHEQITQQPREAEQQQNDIFKHGEEQLTQAAVVGKIQKQPEELLWEDNETANLLSVGNASMLAAVRVDKECCWTQTRQGCCCENGQEKGLQRKTRQRRLYIDLEVVDHEDAAALTKQLNDKERRFAALEGNTAIKELVETAIKEDRPDA